MAARGRDLPAGAGSYSPDRLVSQWCAPEVCRISAGQIISGERDDSTLAFTHPVAIRKIVGGLPYLPFLDEGLRPHHASVREEDLRIRMHALHRRQVEHVLPHVHLRDLDALGKDRAQLQERRLEL